MESYAHSERDGLTAQTYANHVWNVVVLSRCFFRIVRNYVHMFQTQWCLDVISVAAEYHDFGKLDERNQAVLNGKQKSRNLPINHVDGGVSLLTDDNPSFSALLVYSHHRGLPDMSQLENKGIRDWNVKQRTDECLTSYLSLHQKALEGKSAIDFHRVFNEPDVDLSHAIDVRLLFSCLVHADHTDSSIRRRAVDCLTPSPKLNPKRRLERLKSYVSSLAKGSENAKRNGLRKSFFEESAEGNQKEAIAFCDAPVGTGKTTAIMANLLAVAEKNSLRRIFVILPFTNIIRQSVDVYRKALVLEGESPSEVVAEIHHRADFQDKKSRQLTALWNAPIIVTTAVTFFETLSSNRPSSLRRLQQLPGSAIFLDEAHATLPAKLLPLAWRWICHTSDAWRCKWLLASGSLCHFWELPEVSIPNEKRSVENILTNEMSRTLADFECGRVDFLCHKQRMTVSETAQWCSKLDGPVLIVVNTVHTAAALAKAAEKYFGAGNVLHLSSSLTPNDQKVTLQYAKSRLAYKGHAKWCLVATSCVEAGVDLSFHTGVRESASLLALLQLAGRVNRNGEYNDSNVWTISLDSANDPDVRSNPAYQCSSRILNEYFDNNCSISPHLCTNALKREIREMATLSEDSNDNPLVKDEINLSFETLASEFKVIDGYHTELVVVDSEVLAKITNDKEISWRDIQNASVRINTRIVKALAIEEIKQFPGVYAWTRKYSPFIGYMEEVLDFQKIQEDGYAIL